MKRVFFPIEWKLTAAESRVLAHMLDGEIHDVYDLAAAYSRNGDDNKVSSARVAILRIRRKIAPIQIRLVWSRGYIIDPPELEAIQKAIGETV